MAACLIFPVKFCVCAACAYAALAMGTLFGQTSGVTPGSLPAPSPASRAPPTNANRAPLATPPIPGGANLPTPAITPGPAIGTPGSVAPSPAIRPGPAIPSTGPGVGAPAPRPVIDPRTGLPALPNGATILRPGVTGGTGGIFVPNNSRLGGRDVFNPNLPPAAANGGTAVNADANATPGSRAVINNGATSLTPAGDLARVPLQFDAALATTFGANANLGLILDGRGNQMQISSLDANAFGATAGFQAGDRILAVNRAWVTSPQMLQAALATSLARSGQAWVYVNRQGTPQWVNLDLSGRTRGLLGVNLLDNAGNVGVSRVYPGSVARAAGLQPGDQILSANGTSVSSSAELVQVIRTAAAGNGEVNFVVRRDGYEQTLKATLTTNEAIAAAAAAPGGASVSQGGSAPRSVVQTEQLRARAQSLRAALGRLKADGEVSSENVAEFRAAASELLEVLDALEGRLK